MCRSIRTLRSTDADSPATTGEARAAALQYVRKISGYRTPSRRNAEAFAVAVNEIAAATQRLLEALGTPVADGPDPWDDPAFRGAQATRTDVRPRATTPRTAPPPRPLTPRGLPS